MSALPGPAANGEYYTNENVTLTARPSDGYIFVNWSGNTGGITDVSQAVVSVLMDKSRVLTANFAPSMARYAVTAAAEPLGGGSIVLSPNEDDYAMNQVVSVTASSNEGYVFSQWTGDAGGTSPILTLTVDGEKRIVAVFDPKVTVQCDPVEGGTAEVTSPRSSGGYATGTEITIEAAASKGYKFKSWGGDLSGSDNPTSVSMDSPKTLTVHFMKDSVFPWWWIIIGIVLLFGGLIALRLAYVVATRRSEPT